MFSRFSHVVAYIITSFLWLINSPLYGIQYLHSLVNRLLAYLFFLTTINNADTNTSTSFWVDMFSTLLGMHLGAELLGHMVTLGLTFWRMAMLIFKAACTVLYSHQQDNSFLNLTYYWASQVVWVVKSQTRLSTLLLSITTLPSIPVLISVCAQSLSCVQLFVTLWTVTHQPPLSMEFSRQEY